MGRVEGARRRLWMSRARLVSTTPSRASRPSPSPAPSRPSRPSRPSPSPPWHPCACLPRRCPPCGWRSLHRGWRFLDRCAQRRGGASGRSRCSRLSRCCGAHVSSGGRETPCEPLWRQLPCSSSQSVSRAEGWLWWSGAVGEEVVRGWLLRRVQPPRCAAKLAATDAPPPTPATAWRARTVRRLQLLGVLHLCTGVTSTVLQKETGGGQTRT